MDRRRLSGQPHERDQGEQPVGCDVQEVLSVRRGVSDRLVGAEQVRVAERGPQGGGHGVDPGGHLLGAARGAVEVVDEQRESG